MDATLDGQVAIVTGSGQGLGRSEALELARRGARVVVNDVLADKADAVVAEIVAAGRQAVACTDTVTTAEGGEAIVARAVDAFGTVDILVNNAGFMRPGRFEDLSAADISDVIDVHLKAAFHVTQPAWRIMKHHGYGRIVMTGSSAGMFSQGANSNYCAVKAGIFGLARALAYEGAEYGIAVNVVLPFAATSISTSNPVPGVREQREQRGAVYDGPIAHRRTADSVAPLVALLAAPGCAQTGEVYSACAGRYARVFAGVGSGWVAPDVSAVTVESLAEHWDEIRSTAEYTEPPTMFDEVAEVIRLIDRAAVTA